MNIIKKILPRSIYNFLVRVYLFPKNLVLYSHNKWYGEKFYNFIKEHSDKKIILLLGVHEYGNIGDHAISLAERTFLNHYFPDEIIVEIPTSCFIPNIKKYSSLQFKQLTIVIHGGGYLGNLWISEETMLRRVIQNFQNNKIVVFPQSIFFTKDKDGRKQEKITKKIYNSHKNITFFIRDKSFSLLKNEILNNSNKYVFNVPDIVLFLNRSENIKERHGILFVFRNDKEKITNDKELSNLKEKALKTGENVNFSDTCVNYMIPPELGKYITKEKFDEFKEYKLIITDRLHGMIFACITGTPCIALDNISKKVQGVYELWLKNISYIKFVHSSKEAIPLIPEMLSLGGQTYNPNMFEKYWNKIADS